MVAVTRKYYAEVASGVAQEYPEYEAMAEEVRKATEMVAMACEVEVHG